MFKGLPLLVTADNQRLYYGGSKGRNVLIWHDDEELLEIHRATIEQAADIHPIEVLFIEYDTIQEMTTYPDKKAYREYLTSIKSSMPEEEYSYAEEVFMNAAKTSYSRTFHAQGKGYGPKTN